MSLFMTAFQVTVVGVGVLVTGIFVYELYDFWADDGVSDTR